MLENSSYPFASKILEAVKRNEEQAARGVAMEGIPPELLQQLQAGAGEGAIPTGAAAQAAAMLPPAGTGTAEQPLPPAQSSGAMLPQYPAPPAGGVHR